jgi:hypothetical protein
MKFSFYDYAHGIHYFPVLFVAFVPLVPLVSNAHRYVNPP